MTWGTSHARLGATCRTLGCAALVTGWLVVACGSSTEGRVMGGDEIRTLFSGKTVRGHHERFGYDFRSFYEPAQGDAGGRFRSHQSDKAQVRAARWWIVEDWICIRWDDRPTDLCRNMVDTGASQGRYRKVEIDGDRRAIVVTFESFEEGNPQGL